MKIFGKQIAGPQNEILVIPRSHVIDGKEVIEDIVFMAKAVLETEKFDELVPVPKPPFITEAGKGTTLNLKDSDFLKKIDSRNIQFMNWLILSSLSVTPGLEWERVDLTKPETWDKWKDELKAAGFNRVEITHIENLAIRVNSLDEEKMNEARSRFLASRGTDTEK